MPCFSNFYRHLQIHCSLDLVLHLGSLVPVLYLYRAAIIEIIQDCVRFTPGYWEQTGVRITFAVCLGSFPTAIIGLLFEDVISAMFHAPETLAISFALTRDCVVVHTEAGSRNKLTPHYIPLVAAIGHWSGSGVCGDTRNISFWEYHSCGFVFGRE